jgi:hypothetical protein
VITGPRGKVMKSLDVKLHLSLSSLKAFPSRKRFLYDHRPFEWELGMRPGGEGRQGRTRRTRLSRSFRPSRLFVVLLRDLTPTASGTGSD